MLYDLSRADVRVKWLVTCLLLTFGLAYLFGGWMVALYAGFTPGTVAATYAGAEMSMAMPPETTVVVERPMTMAQFTEAAPHQVDLPLLVQDTHVHVPMYGVIAACLSLVVLGLQVSRRLALGLISVLFAAPWLDFLGMWLTKFVGRGFAYVTLLGGWAMAVGLLIVLLVALRQMWFWSERRAT
jgi:hypothetical protein